MRAARGTYTRRNGSPVGSPDVHDYIYLNRLQVLFGWRMDDMFEALEPFTEHDEKGRPLVRKAVLYGIILKGAKAVERHRRHGIATAVRESVLDRDGYECQYCGLALSSATAHVDHVVPMSQGGRAGEDNLVAACPRCNIRKGNRTPEAAGLVLKRQPVDTSLERQQAAGEALRRLFDRAGARHGG